MFSPALTTDPMARRVEVHQGRVAVYLFVFTFAVPLAILAFGGPVVT